MKPSESLLFLLLLLSFSISGQILNRSFELAAPMEPNGPAPYYIPPQDWGHENYTGIHSEFSPVPPQSWTFEEADEGDYFLVMHTGSNGVEGDASITKAKVWQRIFLPAWTLIRGVYYFGTMDYKPYSDYGAISLVPYTDPNDPNDPNDPCDPNDPNCPEPLQEIEIARCSVNDVPDHGSTGGWIPFSYTILPQQEGDYELVMMVADGIDTIVESYFAVDNLSICGPMTPPGDVTRDCTVNMDDLAFFSREWLQICSIDPNTLPDPNDPGYISDPNDPNYIDPNDLSDPNCMCADFTNDNLVDANDLYPLHENWLTKDIENNP